MSTAALNAAFATCLRSLARHRKSARAAGRIYLSHRLCIDAAVYPLPDYPHPLVLAELVRYLGQLAEAWRSSGPPSKMVYRYKRCRDGRMGYNDIATPREWRDMQRSYRHFYALGAAALEKLRAVAIAEKAAQEELTLEEHYQRGRAACVVALVEETDNRRKWTATSAWSAFRNNQVVAKGPAHDISIAARLTSVPAAREAFKQAAVHADMVVRLHRAQAPTAALAALPAAA